MSVDATERPTILVTLDGSHFSEAILGTATSLAARIGATVELFTVGRPATAHDTPSARSYSEVTPAGAPNGTRMSVPLPSALMAPLVETREQALDRMGDEQRDYLQARAAELTEVSTSMTVVLDDDPARAIIAHARRTRPALIAMATHGRTGVAHLLAGSVCEAVIRSGVSPVLVIRP
jgi:nucleotide-binding universal stress UspA family protein